MNKTKKMPISIGYRDVKTRANEFLVPNLCNDGSLIGVKSGKKYLYGAISFIGVEISSTDIIDKMISNGLRVVDVEQYKFRLNQYIDEIYKYKIGNIIFAELDEDNNIILNKVANRPEKQ